MAEFGIPKDLSSNKSSVTIQSLFKWLPSDVIKIKFVSLIMCKYCHTTSSINAYAFRFDINMEINYNTQQWWHKCRGDQGYISPLDQKSRLLCAVQRRWTIIHLKPESTFTVSQRARAVTPEDNRCCGHTRQYSVTISTPCFSQWRHCSALRNAEVHGINHEGGASPSSLHCAANASLGFRM